MLWGGSGDAVRRQLGLEPLSRPRHGRPAGCRDVATDRVAAVRGSDAASVAAASSRSADCCRRPALGDCTSARWICEIRATRPARATASSGTGRMSSNESVGAIVRRASPHVARRGRRVDRAAAVERHERCRSRREDYPEPLRSRGRRLSRCAIGGRVARLHGLARGDGAAGGERRAQRLHGRLPRSALSAADARRIPAARDPPLASQPAGAAARSSRKRRLARR